MKYKLVDVKSVVEEDVEFGTCELCCYFGNHYYDVLVFEDETGHRYEEENGGWNWGDYDAYWNIDNYVKFAHFINDRDYNTVPDDYGSIYDTVNNMYWDYLESEGRKY
jgi:hypothetical protein